MEKPLDFLQNDGCLYKEDCVYDAAPKPFAYDCAHYEAVMAIRRREMEQMKGLVRTPGCDAQYIIRALDDPAAAPCGHCANCLGRPIFPENVSFEAWQAAAKYVDGMVPILEPRKRWPAFGKRKAGKIQYQNRMGICLSKYGDPGPGELARQGKYAAPPRFSDALMGEECQAAASADPRK